jgi:hypothetical protein
MVNTKVSTAKNIKIGCMNKNCLLQDPERVLRSGGHFVVAIFAGLKENPRWIE